MYILSNIKRNKAQIFILLFWIIIILTGIVLGLASRVSYETDMVSAMWHKTQAYFVSCAGIEQTMKVLNEDDSSVDSWWDDWLNKPIKGEVETNGRVIGKWEVKVIYDEERFIDINKVPADVLKRIFYPMTGESVNGPVLYYSLLDWRDNDNNPRQNPATGQIMGTEDNYYLPKFGYECRDGFLESLYELGMIKGGEGLFKKLTGQAYLDSLKTSSYHIKHRFKNHKRELGVVKFGNNIAYAHSGGHAEHGSPPVGPPPPPPPPPPSPPDEWPPFNPKPPGVTGPGRSVTVYGDGRLNVNTAFPGALLAMGLHYKAVQRIFWYKLQGNIFPRSDAQTIINELVKTGWLYPRKGRRPPEKAYNTIVSSIRQKAPRLKVNSSYFFVYIESHASKARHFALAVIKRDKMKNGASRCRVVTWWEWTLNPIS